MATEDDVPDDRRGMERRIGTLEQRQPEILLRLGNAEAEVRYMRQTLDSRYGALHEGQAITVSKLDSIASKLDDAGLFPAGRSLLALTGDLAERSQDHERKLDGLSQMADRLDGALTLAKTLGISTFVGVIGVLVVMVMIFLRLSNILGSVK